MSDGGDTPPAGRVFARDNHTIADSASTGRVRPFFPAVRATSMSVNESVQWWLACQGAAEGPLTTDEVLYSSRITLKIQEAADKNLRNVPL